MQRKTSQVCPKFLCTGLSTIYSWKSDPKGKKTGNMYRYFVEKNMTNRIKCWHIFFLVTLIASEHCSYHMFDFRVASQLGLIQTFEIAQITRPCQWWCVLLQCVSSDFSCKESGTGKNYNQTWLLCALLQCEISCDICPCFWRCTQLRDIYKGGCLTNESSWCVYSGCFFLKLCDHSFCTEVFHPVPLLSQQVSHQQQGLLCSQDFLT